MTEDQINPLCQQLHDSIVQSKPEVTAAVAVELLAGFLTDINRIAWFLQQSYESGVHRR